MVVGIIDLHSDDDFRLSCNVKSNHLIAHDCSLSGLSAGFANIRIGQRTFCTGVPDDELAAVLGSIKWASFSVLGRSKIFRSRWQSQRGGFSLVSGSICFPSSREGMCSPPCLESQYLRQCQRSDSRQTPNHQPARLSLTVLDPSP